MTHSLVLTIFKKKSGVGGSWLKYLLLIPLMLLTIPFVFCLFHKIIISCITKYMTDPSTEMMTRLEAVDQMYSLINSVTLEGNGTPLQYSCRENPMHGGAW